MSIQSINFYWLNPRYLEEFLQLNGQPLPQSDDELRDKAKQLFNTPGVQYTEPIVDLYIASHLDQSKIPQTYTPTQIVNLSDQHQQIFSQILSVPIIPIDQFNLRVIRILDLIGKIEFGNDNNDELIKTARGEMGIDFSQALASGNIQQIKQAFRDKSENHQEFFDQIVEYGNVNILNEMKAQYPDEYDYIDPYLLFDLAIESGNPQMMKQILKDIEGDEMEEQEYVGLIDQIVETGNVDWVQQVVDDFYPNSGSYFAAVRSGSIPMLTYIQSLPMIRDDELHFWNEQDIADFKDEVSNDKLVEYAGQIGAQNIMTHLLQQSPESINSALLGEVKRKTGRVVAVPIGATDEQMIEALQHSEPSLDRVKQHVHQGATNIEEAMMATSDKNIFDWLLDQRSWSVDQLNKFLIKSAQFNDNELIIKLVQLGANQIDLALANAVRQDKTEIVPILRQIGQINDNRYLEILNQVLIEMVNIPDEQGVSKLVHLGAQDLNSALIEAAKLGRLKIMELLIGLGATNLQQAYQMADPEKQGWIHRRFVNQV